MKKYSTLLIIFAFILMSLGSSMVVEVIRVSNEVLSKNSFFTIGILLIGALFMLSGILLFRAEMRKNF